MIQEIGYLYLIFKNKAQTITVNQEKSQIHKQN